MTREEWLKESIVLLAKPTGHAELDMVCRIAAAKAQAALDAVRHDLPMQTCFCHHCRSHFQKPGLVTFCCGRCADEGHVGSKDGCLACEDNHLWRSGSLHLTSAYGDPPGTSLPWAEQLTRKAG